MLTAKQLMNKRVIAPKGRKNKERRIGKVRRFVFHPREKRCIGFIVKRPDAALMFKREDLFVAIDRITVIDDEIHVDGADGSSGAAAIKRLDVEWDNCVLWVGMQIISENESVIGTVGDVAFDEKTGKVDSIVVDNGATARVLLGVSTIPASMIKGFRFGIGSRLSGYEEEIDEPGDDEEEASDVDMGAILVSDEVLELSSEGGLAEKAGRASVTIGIKSREAVEKAKTAGSEAAEKAASATSEAAEKAKPQMQEAGAKAGEAVNKGAFLLGQQLAKSKTMFDGFKTEYNKALNGEDGEDEKQGQ